MEEWSMGKKAVFLDRDGVINEVLTKRVKFVNKPSEFFLLKGAGEAIRLFNENEYLVFVVTNQGGIGLGFMKEEQLIRVHEKMIQELAKFGAIIDEIVYCPHKPREGCACRKPNAKMLTDLAGKHDVDITCSYMVGDRDVDIIAGQKSGAKTVLIGDEHAIADFYFPSLLDAANWIITRNA
jgi:D-glycero-D-manno-heptose 1,7-bisphosphate phosphatase